MTDDAPKGLGPYDTPASASLRFVMEVVAWVAGPWAAADLTGSGWVATGTLFVLVVLPSIFSTEGDKNQVVVSTPGPTRLMIELLLFVVAVAGAWISWPPWLAIAVSLAGIAALFTGLPRLRWLASGAPLPR